jgi:tetratricopeptide (TPR) repeat protein
MLGKRKGKKLRRVAGSSLFVLLCFALFGCWGCTTYTPRRSSVDATGTVPSQKSEAQLIVEIEKKFESPQAHYELARIYHESGEWTKAEMEYSTALGFEPGNKAAQAGFVKMFMDRGQKTKGEQYAEKYIRQASIDANGSLRLAWEFEKLGLNDYALRCFRQALAIAPDSAEVNKQLGLYYQSKGDTAKAKEHFSRSFQANPNQPDVAGALGRLGVVVQTPREPESPRAREARSKSNSGSL